MTTHADHRYSITVSTDDLALVGCLRALAKFSQRTGNNNIPWGGTKDADWRAAGKRVTFRFSTSAYREEFKTQVRRLLPAELLTFQSESDTDPARPQDR